MQNITSRMAENNRESIFERNSIFIMLIILLEWGVPFNFAGIPVWMSAYIASALIFFVVLIRIIRVSTYGIFDKWELGIFSFILYCYFVTVISNTFIFDYSFSEWGVSLTYLFPLLLALCIRPLQLEARHIVDGVVLATTLAAIIVVIDQITPLSQLDDFVHVSTISGNNRRIVLMHNESAFALAMVTAILLNKNNISSIFRASISLILLTISLVFVSESRLAVGASGLGIFLYFTFFYKGKNKLIIYMIGCLVVSIFSYFFLYKYIDAALQVDNISSSDNSTIFRLIEIEHFRSYFEETGGLGFGLMSLSPAKKNFIAQSLYVLASLYHVDYLISLIDIRIYSALFQFGYIGLAGVLILTFTVIKESMKIGARRIHPFSQQIAATGCVVLGFMISPLPINLFTADNTVLIGGLIYALVASAAPKTRPRPHRLTCEPRRRGILVARPR